MGGAVADEPHQHLAHVLHCAASSATQRQLTWDSVRLQEQQSPFDQTTTRCKQSAKNMISVCRAREHIRCLFSADWNENTGTISLCQCAGVEDHSGGEG